MTKYEEVCEACNNAVRRWNGYRERSWGYLSTIVRGLVTDCGVPQGKIAFLRSNGLPGEKRRYSPPEDGGFYTLPGAITFEEDEYWHLGIAITLSPPGVFPERWIGAVLCVTEDAGKAVVKIGGNGKPREIDFTNTEDCVVLYYEVAEFLKNCFENPKKLTTQIGFSTVANPQQGEKLENPRPPDVNTD